MFYAIFSQRRFSHRSDSHWRFEALTQDEEERDELLAEIRDEMERTTGMRLVTIGYKVVELGEQDKSTKTDKAAA